MFCDDVNCSSSSHIAENTKFYTNIVNCLKESGAAVLGDPGKKVNVKPGWSDHVSDLYKASREMYLQWASAGKPRQGPLFNIYRTSKAKFKYALRYVKRHEAQMRKESLANKLSDMTPQAFWKEVKHINNSKTQLPISFVRTI